MILHNENVKQVFSRGKTQQITLLNIPLILFYSVFKTLKQNYMLNLTSSDKTSETLFRRCNHCRLDSLSICWHMPLYLYRIA